jgi:hypothetical protein
MSEYPSATTSPPGDNVAHVAIPVLTTVCYFWLARLVYEHCVSSTKLLTFPARDSHKAGYLHSAFRVHTLRWCLRELDGARVPAGDDVRHA